MGGCTPVARTRPLVSGARTSGQRWGGAEAGRCPALPRRPAAGGRIREGQLPAPRILACLSRSRPPDLDTARPALRLAQHPPGSRFKPHAGRARGILSFAQMARRRAGSPPAPEEAPRSTSRHGSAPPPPAALALLPAATQRQSHVLWRRGAESAGCAFRGRQGEVTPSPNLLLRRESRSRGLRPEGGRGRLEPFRVPRPLAPPHSCLVGNKTPRPGRVIGHPDGDICLLNLDVSCAPHLAVLQGLLAGFCIPPLTSAPFRGSPPSISSLPHHRVTSNLPAFYLWHLDPRPAPAPDPRLALSPSPLAPTPSSPGPRGALVTLRPVPAGLTAPARVPFLLTRALACLQSKVTLWLRD